MNIEDGKVYNLTRILDMVVEEELAAATERGKKLRLKSVFRKRLILTGILLPIFLVAMYYEAYDFAFAVMIFYYFRMYKINDLNVIKNIAAERRDTPISEIIEEEKKR